MGFRAIQLLTPSVIYFYQCNSQIPILCCGYNPVLTLFILFKVIQIWPLGAPLGWFSCILSTYLQFLVSISLLLTTQDVPASYVFPAPALGSALSPKQAWFLLLESST